jgi:DNA-binding MarR family transcriptional regulator
MQLEEEIKRIIELNKALGDGVRLAIMLYLQIKGKAGFTELASGLGISPGRLAHHLDILERLNYVVVSRSWDDLRRRTIRPTSKGLDALKKYLSYIRALMGANRVFEACYEPHKG